MEGLTKYDQPHSAVLRLNSSAASWPPAAGEDADVRTARIMQTLKINFEKMSRIKYIPTRNVQSCEAKNVRFRGTASPGATQGTTLIGAADQGVKTVHEDRPSLRYSWQTYILHFVYM